MVNMSVSPHAVMESSKRSSSQELMREVSGARYQSLWAGELATSLRRKAVRTVQDVMSDPSAAEGKR